MNQDEEKDKRKNLLFFHFADHILPDLAIPLQPTCPKYCPLYNNHQPLYIFFSSPMVHHSDDYSLPLPLSVCLSLSLSISLCLSLSPSISLFLSLSISIYLFLSVTHAPFLPNLLLSLYLLICYHPFLRVSPCLHKN